MKSCKIKDDGDATINNFQITPLSGPQGTTFKAFLNYVSNNAKNTNYINNLIYHTNYVANYVINNANGTGEIAIGLF